VYSSKCTRSIQITKRTGGTVKRSMETRKRESIQEKDAETVEVSLSKEEAAIKRVGQDLHTISKEEEVDIITIQARKDTTISRHKISKNRVAPPCKCSNRSMLTTTIQIIILK
jgi:hypothetical protein